MYSFLFFSGKVNRHPTFTVYMFCGRVSVLLYLVWSPETNELFPFCNMVSFKNIISTWNNIN